MASLLTKIMTYSLLGLHTRLTLINVTKLFGGSEAVCCVLSWPVRILTLQFRRSIYLPHSQHLHPPSLICYLNLSKITFSQSQGESSLGRVSFHELQISHCFHHSFPSLLFGNPGKKQRKITSTFFPNTHSKYVLCLDDTIYAIKFPCCDLTYYNAASGLYSACICD